MGNTMTLPEVLMGFIISGMAVYVGAILLWGAMKKPKFLIDPPDDYWFILPNGLIKKLIGRKGLILYLYVSGGALLLGGSVGLTQCFWRLGRGLGYWG